MIAKPLAAGLPLGAILASDAVAEKIGPRIYTVSTFGGGPLVCATALEFLKTVEDNKLLENVRARGTELRAGLAALAKKFNFIREIRGEGLMIGVELSIEGAPFVIEATRRGLLMNCTHDFTLRVLPPFIVTKAQVREFLQLFESVLASNTTSKAESVPAAKKPERSLALGPLCGEVKRKTMPTATLAASILLVNDLLTGAEWSAAQTRELLQLTAQLDVELHPERYSSKAARKVASR